MGIQVCLGVIGGSGVYQMEGAEIVRTHDIQTPFGAPSAPVVEAKVETSVGNKSVFFIPRHGIGHHLLPSEVPYKANIFALKKLGVTHVLAVSAVGIMRDDIKPGDMVIPDQLFDRTKGIRDASFFGQGLVGHVGFADPFCEEMRTIAIEATVASGARLYKGGTYVAMEGPIFSTRAESHFYRQTLSPSIIGMTAIPEAKLAREAELSYGLLATATDYDCWHATEEDVSVEAVLKVLKANGQMVQKIVKKVAELLPATSSAPALSAAKYALMTSKEAIPKKVKDDLHLLYGKYWS
jgi:5'-methylthioadenosine phosphorylase